MPIVPSDCPRASSQVIRIYVNTLYMRIPWYAYIYTHARTYTTVRTDIDTTARNYVYSMRTYGTGSGTATLSAIPPAARASTLAAAAS